MKHHIIPRHAGGTDDPSNIEEITTEEHADRHRILFETYGRWQDYLAWRGLAGLSDSSECSEFSMRMGAKRGAQVTNSRYPKGTRKSWKFGGGRLGKDNLYAKNYRIQCPNGTVILVECLTTFCVEIGLKYNSFHKAVVERSRSFKGYSLKEKLGRKRGL